MGKKPLTELQMLVQKIYEDGVQNNASHKFKQALKRASRKHPKKTHHQHGGKTVRSRSCHRGRKTRGRK